MEKRLAITADGRMTYCSAAEDLVGKGRCNHIAHQLSKESRENFLNRMSENEVNYGKYMPDEEYLLELEERLKRYIPEDLMNDIQKVTNGESWIIAYGYDEEPYQNKGGWGCTEPYPFLTSDGKSFIEMYKLDKQDVYNINDENFVTAFNKNKNLKLEAGSFVLDRNKKLYKAQYPNVDSYDHVFIKHIPSN